MNTPQAPIRIDVISDVVCPWCYIGKRRLEKALENTHNSENVQVIYHPFQLDPSIPTEGIDFQTYAYEKFGANYLQKFMQVEQAGSNVGLAFDFEALPKAINTFHLHRLLALAAAEGFQAALKEALLKAYFIEQKDLTADAVLVELLANFGWAAEKTLAIIHSDEGSDTVKEAMHYFKQLGIGGVPFFIFNKKYALSGAQPSEVFEQVFQQIQSELAPSTATTADVCDTETGVC